MLKQQSLWAACAWTLPMLGLPAQADTSTSFAVRAVIESGCLVNGALPTADGGQWGSLDFGQHPATSEASVTASLVNSQTMVLQCTPGVALAMRVDGGLNNDGNRNLRRAGGSELLPYELYSDAALSQAILVEQNVALSYSDANDIRLPLYGRVRLTGSASAGEYRDTLRVTLEW